MPQELRIIDENLNRLSEGLRVLEDISRMILNDTGLTQQLKTMRHEFIRADISFNKQLLQSRDSENDIGADMEVSGEKDQRELTDILVANSRRAQESLRLLEEMAKLPGISIDSRNYKAARFSLYTLERNLLSRLFRQDKIKRLTGLYVIIDTEALQGRDHINLARQAIRGGAKTIQLRDKVSYKRELLHTAQRLKELCIRNNVLFIINDHLDLALATDADGLHLGQNDLPISIARKELPIDKIIGGSAETFDQAITATADGADYIGVGAIFPTSTKTDIDVCGLSVLKQVTKTVKIPVVAIGGINKSNIKKVIAAGADAIAIISSVLQAADPETATRELVGLIEK